MEKFDVIFLGAGSGGYVGAIRSADLGKKVCIIEERDLGGTCLNRGCIPTKALLKSADVYNTIKEAKVFGINVDSFSYDPAGIFNWKENVIKRLVSGIEFLLKSRRVVIIKGRGKIIDNETLEVETPQGKEIVKGENIVIATGSEPARIPAFKIDGINVLTSDDALNLREIPKDILIVGAGAIGIEFATFYSAFGSKVTIVEMMPQVVPTLRDKKIASLIQKILSKEGIDVKVGAKIESIEVKDSKVYSTLSTGEILESEKVLVSIGRKLNSDNIGLENIGVETDKGRIVVDEYLRTNVRNIYAIGDVIGGLLLAHKAMKEGEVVAETIAGDEKKMDYRVLPWAIFSSPEIAVVGLTEEEAKEQGIDVVTGEVPFTANGKAVSMNATDGLVKVVARKEDNVIVGAQIVGPEASIMISELSLAIKKNLTLNDISDTIHTHPTLPETTAEAVKVPLGSVVHIVKR
ncbi:MAG TPA: dihydrolipoyl dehydrogenase [Dictyoglomaceae bacterium]|nr:dihydrolipoyl dehydrogenase [Dictyoglomaceae bacterium]HOL39429.1 dihydrolipoyl dehydrogenase [Dictyoglomaceae bacterium]HPP16378.1 dihydrolipoyl dehydrogenase [Dictyoglomaceae bacterium]HPU43488.1 dihydrolipoyl dehydrogenase [Dictyoglomaceae bacterium]